MDHLALAQMLGSYGEFIGAIAVVVTLAYLATQIRQQRLAMIAATIQARSESVNATPEIYDPI